MYQQTDELMHYGVPGMKWGRRKTNKISSSKKKKKKKPKRYSKEKQKMDQYVYGKSGVKRIEKRMSKGSSYTKAQLMEYGRIAVKNVVMTGIMDQMLLGGYIRKTTIHLAGKKFVDSYMKSKATQSLAKIAQNHKFDPIDVVYKIVN